MNEMTEEEFKTLLEWSYPGLMRHAWKIYHVNKGAWPWISPEDIAQECALTMVKLFNKGKLESGMTLELFS